MARITGGSGNTTNLALKNKPDIPALTGVRFIAAAMIFFFITPTILPDGVH